MNPGQGVGEVYQHGAPSTMTLGTMTDVPAKRMLTYYRISWCLAPMSQRRDAMHMHD